MRAACRTPPLHINSRWSCAAPLPAPTPAPLPLSHTASPLPHCPSPPALQLETDKVFVSAYLDRLLGVNEDDYRFEARRGGRQRSLAALSLRRRRLQLRSHWLRRLFARVACLHVGCSWTGPGACAVCWHHHSRRSPCRGLSPLLCPQAVLYFFNSWRDMKAFETVRPPGPASVCFAMLARMRRLPCGLCRSLRHGRCGVEPVPQVVFFQPHGARRSPITQSSS